MAVRTLDTGEMLEHFTEDELERMSAFTETPTYERTPEQLLPEDAEETAEPAPPSGTSSPAPHR